jgi:4-aminobutyrate aminotransferase / (S)-3-amino-2-methylpropionate transaminase / 5-aminovalerate transaminase
MQKAGNDYGVQNQEGSTSKKALIELNSRYISKALGGNTLGSPPKVFIAHAKGVRVWDTEGNSYLDFGAGGGALNTGYCHDKVVTAIKQQSDKFLHTIYSVIMYESYLRLAQKLVQTYPGRFGKKCVFFSGGAESVENAIRISRVFSGISRVMAFENAFHGRTLLATSLSNRTRSAKLGVGPFVEGIMRVPYAYCYRCPYASDSRRRDCCVPEIIRNNLRKYPKADEIGSMIVESVQGGGGVIVPPENFIRELRKICDEKGFIMIDDEVLCGGGRTGKMWAIEYSNVAPDIICAAKSIGGGLPLGVTMGRADIMDSPQQGAIGTTFGGNPLSCVAGIEAVEIIKDHLGHGRKLGEIMMKRLDQIKEKYEIVGDVRGKGPMVGIELVKNRRSKDPAVEETKAIIEECWRSGLIVLGGGVFRNVIVFFPPLVMSIKDLNAGLDVVEKSIQTVTKNR